MPSLRLFLFGSPHVELDGQAISIERRKTLALLAYLAVSGTRQQRDALAVFFWPEFPPERSRSNLRREIFTLNSAIGNQWLDGDRNTVGLSPGIDLWVDVLQFQKILASNQNTGEAARLTAFKEAVNLYRGDFLTGFSLPNCPDFEEWQFFQREHLRSLYTTALKELATASYPEDELEKAIGYALQWVMADPLNEAAYHLAIRLYLQIGQISAAKAQYERCTTMFKEELQIDPSAETRALYQQIIHHQYSAQRASNQQASTWLDLHRPETLPKNRTPFIGRKLEIEQISDLLEDHRLITLTGSGGVGKTRLSIQVAEKAAVHFPDGVWFIDLSLVIERGVVEQTVATALGLKTRAVQETLVVFLEGKQILLVLDNCEHLIEDCALFVEKVVERCQRVHILATSREVLDLPIETVFRVPSLPIPPLDLLPAQTPKDFLEVIIANEAVQVFSGRARAVQTSFEVTGANALAVARICRRLDGIPLAIELAAARLNILTVAELSERLENAFDLLTGGSRTALPRHRTLRAIIDWSYDLLSHAERHLFASLSVFTGGCTLEAIEEVCGSSELGDKEILNTLSSLVNKSMVIAVQSPEIETRYHILEVIRQYALEKLIKAGGEDTFRLQHMQYYTAFCETAEPHLRASQRLEWTGRLRADLDNIRAAVHWAYTPDGGGISHAEFGLRIAVSSRRLMWTLFLYQQTLDWLIRGLNLLEEKQIPDLVKAWCFYMLGNMKDPIEKQIEYYTQCIQTSRSIGPKGLAVCGSAFMDLAVIHSWFLHDQESARSYVQQGIEAARCLDSNDQWYLGLALWVGSYALSYDISNHNLAYQMATESVEIMRRTGDRWNGAGLHTLGYIEACRGNLDLAIRLIEEELALYTEVNDVMGIIISTYFLAWFHALDGDFIEAFRINQFNLHYCYPDSFYISVTLKNLFIIINLKSQREELPVKIGLLTQAAVIQGIIDRLGKHEEYYQLPIIQPLIIKAEEIFRTELPPEDFNRASAEGFAMSLDQAMTFASSINL